MTELAFTGMMYVVSPAVKPDEPVPRMELLLAPATLKLKPENATAEPKLFGDAFQFAAVTVIVGIALIVANLSMITTAEPLAYTAPIY